MFDINTITRTNVKKLKAYSSARDEFKGEANIWLDANENPYNTFLNRYPDPLQYELKKEVSVLKEISEDQIFIGNGSDEAIDLLFRAFCEPGLSKAILFSPTYGMYEVSAAINNVELVSIPLTSDFEIPSIEIFENELKSTGLLFICSPNNPTGNSTALETVKEIAEKFYGLVVVDEAYIDFSKNDSATSLLTEIPNLVVLQTFSKAYGLAGARVGMAFASPSIISILNKIKPPYNVNSLSIDAAKKALADKEIFDNQITEILDERGNLENELSQLSGVLNVYPSDSNFLLVQFLDAEKVFNKLVEEGIIVRNRSTQIKNCLRITVGTNAENKQLLTTLKEILS